MSSSGRAVAWKHLWNAKLCWLKRQRNPSLWKSERGCNFKRKVCCMLSDLKHLLLWWWHLTCWTAVSLVTVVHPPKLPTSCTFCALYSDAYVCLWCWIYRLCHHPLQNLCHKYCMLQSHFLVYEVYGASKYHLDSKHSKHGIEVTRLLTLHCCVTWLNKTKQWLDQPHPNDGMIRLISQY